MVSIFFLLKHFEKRPKEKKVQFFVCYFFECFILFGEQLETCLAREMMLNKRNFCFACLNLKFIHWENDIIKIGILWVSLPFLTEEFVQLFSNFVMKTSINVFYKAFRSFSTKSQNFLSLRGILWKTISNVNIPSLTRKRKYALCIFVII